MKKSSLILSLVGFGISVFAMCLLFLIPLFMGPDALYTLTGLGTRFGELFKGLFSFPNVQFIQVVWLVAFVILLCFWIAGIVVASLRKRKAAIGGLILFLVEFLTFLFFCALAFQPGWDLTKEPFWTLGSNFSSLESSFSSWGPYGLAGLVIYAKKTHLLGTGWTVFILTSILLGMFGFLLSFIGYVIDMATSGKDKMRKKAKPAASAPKENAPSSTPSVIIVHDDETSDPSANKKSDNSKPVSEPSPAVPASAFLPNPSGIQGPLLVQYINTYSPDATTNPKPSSSTVPVSEIQGAISGEKPLSAEDVRKIVREELLPKEEKQPVIISVPSPVNSKEEKPLSAEDVRKILSEELRKNHDADKEGDVVIEDESEPAPHVLSEADVRSIIAEANSTAAPIEKPAEVPAKEDQSLKAEDIRKMISEEIHKAIPAEKTPEPKPGLTAEDIRGIMKEEFDRRDSKSREILTAASVRQIIRQEMKDVPPLADTKVQPITVVLSASADKPAEISKETKEEPSPAFTEEKEDVSKPRVVGAVNPDLPPHDKIIRIPFQTRMKSAEPSMAKNYNELKSEIMSYGVKSRISNKGDTFRLHKVTFVRITVAGKALKLYFALNPKDYANSPLPIQDVSHKKVYADIPLVFKVKSDLSMKRAKDLISDVMKKNGLTQGTVETKNWIDEIPEPDAEAVDDSEED